MLTIQERWRFESIPNQLVIYSLHKPHSPAKVRYRSPSQLSKNLKFARNHMYPGATDCSLVLSSRPRVLPHLLWHSALRAIYSARIISQLHGRKVLYSPAKCKACVQHDSRPNNGRSLIDTDEKHYSPKLCKSPSCLNFI